MDREECIKLLNTREGDYNVKTIINVLMEYITSRGTDYDTAHKVVEFIFRSPLLVQSCFDYAVNELCLQHKVTTVSKDGQIILFY